MANAVAADPDRYATANYYLTGNIIASEKAWNLAIGSEAKPFIGQFDGRNYYILGLVPGTGVRGLFDTIDFSDTVNIVGGIAAINKGTIDGCGSGVNISSGGTYFKDGQSVPLTELNSTLKGEMGWASITPIPWPTPTEIPRALAWAPWPWSHPPWLPKPLPTSSIPTSPI